MIMWMSAAQPGQSVGENEKKTNHKFNFTTLSTFNARGLLFPPKVVLCRSSLLFVFKIAGSCSGFAIPRLELFPTNPFIKATANTTGP